MNSNEFTTPCRRRSSIAQPCFTRETDSNNIPHAPNSAFYTPPSGGPRSPQAQTSNSNQSSSTHYLGTPSSTSIAQTTTTTSLAPSRRRAVITVDAKTTEILIANDNVCRMFGLKDRSLIGKRLGEVFPVRNGKSQGSLPPQRFVDDFGNEKGPQILDKALFTDDGQLRPVYGKPIDILDADGTVSTVCVWSYPLTSAAAHAAVPPPLRKSSAMILRSPSAFLPSTSQNSSTASTQIAGKTSLGEPSCAAHSSNEATAQ
jgi:hypothetical protein